LAWAAFLFVIIGLGSYKANENERDSAAQLAWQLHTNELVKRRAVDYDRLRAEAKAVFTKPGSQRYLETAGNDGDPFVTRQEQQTNEIRDIADWSDPTYAVHFRLQFRDGALQGYQANYGSGLSTLYPQPARFSLTSRAESVRSAIVSKCGYVWLICFVAWYALLRDRIWPVHLLLALALVDGIAKIVDPRFSLAPEGVFSNDSLFYSGVLLVICINLIVAVLISKRSDPLPILIPRFRLGSLLVATAVIAILLSIGPLGYVILAVGLASFALFTAIYERARCQQDA
jgi:hypothetical protein